MAVFEGPIDSRDGIITRMVTELQQQGWGLQFSGDGAAAGSDNRRVSQVRVLTDADGNNFTIWSRADTHPFSTTIPPQTIQGMLYSDWDPNKGVFEQDLNALQNNIYGVRQVSGYDTQGNFSESSSNLNQTSNFCGTDGEPSFLWLFTGPTYCHAVWQSDPGRYHHFNFGTINKGFDFNGGAYMCGSWRSQLDSVTFGRNPDSDNNCAPFNVIPDVSAFQTARDMFVGDFDGLSMRMCRGHSSSTHDTHELGMRGALTDFAHRFAVPPHTSRTVLIPYWVSIRTTANNDARHMGTIPSARRANIANHSPGDRLDYEGEQWRIFPWSMKRTAYSNDSDLGSTFVYAVAYKE